MTTLKELTIVLGDKIKSTEWNMIAVEHLHVSSNTERNKTPKYGN